jgi:hypothetical protein
LAKEYGGDPRSEGTKYVVGNAWMVSVEEQDVAPVQAALGGGEVYQTVQRT